MLGSISILPSKHINAVKWDECIHQHSNGLIYSTYKYLEHICDNWKGLVVNDYEMVMALPYRKKWGLFPYLYTPPFIQQLGIVGTANNHLLQAVYKKVSRHFWYGDYMLNFTNANWPNTVKKNNYILNCQPTFNVLFNNCSNNFKSRSKKYSHMLHYQSFSAIESIIQVYQQLHGYKTPHVSDSNYIQFIQLCNYLQQQKQALVRVVKQQEEIVAAVVLLLYKNRLYNIANYTTTKGKAAHANYFLFAQLLQEFAATAYILDFEGSDIPSIAHFYKKLMPTKEVYFHWHRNVLNMKS